MRNVQRTSYARRIKALSDERARLARELRDQKAVGDVWEALFKAKHHECEGLKLQSARELREARAETSKVRGERWESKVFEANMEISTALEESLRECLDLHAQIAVLNGYHLDVSLSRPN